MDELYQMIEEKIKDTGYTGPVSGMEIYDEICDEIEDKENGTYLFMAKRQDGTVFEYQVDVMDDQFNLSYVEIRTDQSVYHADFD